MTMNDFSNCLSGKKILVTGATSGIGYAIVTRLLHCGALVTATGRNTGTLSSLTAGEDAVDFKDRVVVKPLDYSNQDSLEKFDTEIDKIDGLVNCVGISQMLPAKLTDYKTLLQSMHINFLAPAFLINKLLRKKKINNGGSIVLISSISGTNISNIGMSNYAASKAALNGYLKSIALEIAPRIRINSVAPGMIDTGGGMFMETMEKMSSEDVEKDLNMYPMGRFGKPGDISGLVAYLLSSEAAWITGQNFVVDGGRTLK